MRRNLSITLFAAASLLPAACLIAAALLGGGWLWAAILSMTALVAALDLAGADTEAGAGLSTLLPGAVALAHFAVLGTVVWAVGPQAMTGLGTGEQILLVLTAGLFVGQISNACAHELIHRSGKGARLLGTAIYCSVLNGQHVSAHMLVHHVHAGTERDPNSAAKGRGFYRFLLSATAAEFLGGWRAETRRRRISNRGMHPYVAYLAGGAVSLTAAFALGGLWGIAALAAISAHALLQLMLSDYVQHYGLRRATDTRGKAEPMGPQHSWNARRPYSNAMMLNAPRHSDHHLHPARNFTRLGHDALTMPTLPYGLPVMGALALVPPVWRRVMDPRVDRWTARPETPADTG